MWSAFRTFAINTGALRHRGLEMAGTSRYRLFVVPYGCWPGSHLFSEVVKGPCYPKGLTCNLTLELVKKQQHQKTPELYGVRKEVVRRNVNS